MNASFVSKPVFSRTVAVFNKLLLAFIISGVLLSGTAMTTFAAQPDPAVAAPRAACSTQSGALAAGPCALDQWQAASNGSVPFGGVTVLSQTFKPARRGPVCKVLVKIRRNTTVGAGVLKLTVMDQNNAVKDSAAILVAPPVGESIQTFTMGCDGGILNPGQTYRLKLEAPTSPVGTYSWLDQGGNPYPAGQGVNALRDYTFWVYICPQ